MILSLAVLALLAGGGPATTSNDDSCDVAVFPAATLLLPFFAVDMTGTSGETTLFTVTNTTNVPNAARVTLWTDFGHPVVHFSIFLTGYDVQSINLFDVIGRGIIGQPAGTGSNSSPRGELSEANNPVVDEVSCSDLPGEIPAPLLERIRAAFTTGKILGGCATAGNFHPDTAIGYTTIDIAGNCGNAIPTDTTYFTTEIRFDNVLIGDYQQVDASRQFAQAGEMVHIRAIPEGGTPSSRSGAAFVSNFPRTFYSRYQPAGMARDARQPLPSLFAARWISGGPAGFRTHFKIWREGHTTSATACSASPALGGALGVTEVVRFDEDENPEVLPPTIIGPPVMEGPVLPSTSRVAADDTGRFPPLTTGAVAGWITSISIPRTASGIHQPARTG